MFNDSSLVAWFNTILLAITTVALSIAAWRFDRFAKSSDQSQNPSRHRAPCWFLLILSILFAIFTVNKQLDLQTYLTDYGRRLSRQQGWYEQRRSFQFKLVIASAIGSAGLLAAIVLTIRRWPRRYHVITAGLMLYILFALLRLSSFSHIDSLLATEIFDIKTSRFLEPLGPMIVLLGTGKSVTKLRVR